MLVMLGTANSVLTWTNVNLAHTTVTTMPIVTTHLDRTNANANGAMKVMASKSALSAMNVFWKCINVTAMLYALI